MALQKQIQDSQTGTVAEYWRLIGIAIDSGSGNAGITLGGYVSDDVRRRPGGRHIADRHLPISGAAFAALAGRKALLITDAHRAEIEAHLLTAPPAVAAFLRRSLDLTVYAAYAEPAYEWSRVYRRQCAIDPDTGEGLIGTERWPAEAIVTFDGIPTVPSEFADAADV